MPRESLLQPTEIEMPRTLDVINLISSECYYGLRKGNVVATSEGYAVKYFERERRASFVGFLGPSRVLEKFLVISPSISGGVLDLRNSDIVRYTTPEDDERALLIRVLEGVGMRQ